MDFDAGEKLENSAVMILGHRGKNGRIGAMKRALTICMIAGLFALLTIGHPLALQTTWNGKTVDISSAGFGSASSEVVRGKGLFYGIVVVTDGTNDVTLAVYDGTSTSGKRLIAPNLVISGTAFKSGWAHSIDPPVTYDTGIYVSVSVAGGGYCSYVAYYSPVQ